MRVGGVNKRIKHLECVDDKRNVWKLRWDFQESEDGISFEEKTLPYKPSLDKIQEIIINWYNKQTDAAILNGFKWKDMMVWLSSENQFNYKAAYDLAVQTGGASLPVKFKFGTSEDPVYYTFTNINDLSDFYMSAMRYINQTLDQGWQQKDNINWKQYNG